MTTSTSLTLPYPQGIGATRSVPTDTDARDLRFFLDFPAAIQAAYAVDNTRLFLNGSSMGTAMTNRIAVNTSGRGRDGSYLPPSAQIRMCGTTAYGSCLGYVTRSDPQGMGVHFWV